MGILITSETKPYPVTPSSHYHYPTLPSSNIIVPNPRTALRAVSRERTSENNNERYIDS
jgi:hypothetical protein